jgi:hypothetical protein
VSSAARLEQACANQRFQSHRDGDELLLRAVVEVAFDRPASVVGRLGDASAGCLQLPKPQSVGDVPRGRRRGSAHRGWLTTGLEGI